MKCEEIKNLMVEEIYGEISKNSQEILHEHLRVCPACRAELRVLKTTSMTLSKWEDEEPDFNLSFSTENTSRLSSISKWLSLKKITYGFSVGFALVVMILALFNSEISYKNGELNIYLGLHKKLPAVSEDGYISRAEFEQYQKDNYEMVSSLISANNTRQKKETLVLLDQFYNQLQQQQQTDLQYISSELKALRYGAATRFNQTDQILSSLIRYAGRQR